MRKHAMLKIPALQRVGSRACVACGEEAEAFCSRCGVTPYCSGRCQRRDWIARHQAVCHNLARLASGRDALDTTDAVEPTYLRVVPPPAPLRRPHSPSKDRREPVRLGQQDSNKQEKQGQRQERQDDGSDRHNNKIFTAPGHVKAPQQHPNSAHGGGRNNSNNNKNNNNNNKNNNNNGDRRPYNRRPQANKENEDWDMGKKAEPEPKEVAAPKPAPEMKPTASPAKSHPKAEPKPETPQANIVTPTVKKPGNVSDVTPAKKFMPKNYVIEMLSIGDTALLSVDAVTSSCASRKPGFVCLSMHDRFEADYQALCETYVVDCEADQNGFQPSPGDLFSYLSPEDGGWYRARSLGRDNAALIDSSKTIKLQSSDATKRLAKKYEEMPEFSCVLDSPRVKLGDNLKCTLVAKTADGYNVSLDNIETGASIGKGIISRWIPDIEYPPQVAATQSPVIPEVPRPDVTNNSKVLLVDITAVDRGFVRPADLAAVREYDQILQDVYLHAAKASPLPRPPKRGDTVIGKFTDGCFYRALVKRTNVAQNKYLLEYIDFGNLEISKLENLYPCPVEYDLSTKPTVASLVKLHASCGNALTPPATEYLDSLKDANVELVLTIPSGEKSAPSGSAVKLAVAKSNESVNRKVEEYCTPDWKKMEHKGADVVESPKLMYDSLKYPELSPGACELEVLDISALQDGSVSGHERGLQQQQVLAQLTDRMGEYCNSELGRQPYLPALEELCIAQCPPYPQWFRAVVVEHSAGDAEAKVLYIDYGNIELVPVTLLRKMLPEFARQPALAIHLEIRGFPNPPSDAMLSRALEHMQINEEGRGRLRFSSAQQQEPGLYTVDAPDLLKAMGL